MNVKFFAPASTIVMSLFLFSSVSSAQKRSIAQFNSTTSSYHVGVSLLNHNAGKASSSAQSGDKPFFGQIYNQLDLMAFFPVKNNLIISPIFNLSITSKKSPEGEQKTSVSMIGVRALKPWTSNLDYHFGLGFIAYQIKGSGGNVNLSNGTGVSTFGTPSDTSSSSQLYYDLGLGYSFQKYRIELSTLATEVFAGSKLALNPMLTFSMEIYR